jgi:hypothetical protein
MRIAPPSAFALCLLTAGTIAVIIKATRAVEISFMLLPMPIGGAIPHSLMIVQNAWALALNPRQSPRVGEYRGSTYVRSQRSISASYCAAADMARTWPRCGHCEVTLKREDAATLGKEVDAQALSVGAPLTHATNSARTGAGSCPGCCAHAWASPLYSARDHTSEVPG